MEECLKAGLSSPVYPLKYIPLTLISSKPRNKFPDDLILPSTSNFSLGFTRPTPTSPETYRSLTTSDGP